MEFRINDQIKISFFGDKKIELSIKEYPFLKDCDELKLIIEFDDLIYLQGLIDFYILKEKFSNIKF